MLETPSQEIKLFYCYAREDKELRDIIDRHLKVFKRQYFIQGWHDREILPGTEWEKSISDQLDSANLILLLISPDFIASEYCYGKELQRAFERHLNGECHLVPILLRPTHWQDTLFSNLQILPTDARPVTLWESRDLAFYDVVGGVDLVLRKLVALPKTAKNWLDEGISLYDAFQYEEALLAFSEAIKLDPSCIKAYINRDKILQNLGISKEAQEKLNEDWQATKEQLVDQQEQSEQLTKRLSDTSRRLVEQQEQSEQLTKKLSDTRRRLAEQQTRSEQLTKKLSDTRRRLVEQQEQSEQLTKKLSDTRRRLAEQQTRSEQLTKKLSDTRRRLAEQQEQSEQLTKKLSDTRQQLEEQQEQSEQLTKKLSDTRQQLTNQQKKTEQIEKKLSVAQQQITDQQEQSKQLPNSLNLTPQSPPPQYQKTFKLLEKSLKQTRRQLALVPKSDNVQIFDDDSAVLHRLVNQYPPVSRAHLRSHNGILPTSNPLSPPKSSKIKWFIICTTIITIIAILIFFMFYYFK